MIIYLTNMEIPSKKAHAIQICKSVSALSAFSVKTILTVRKKEGECSQITGISQRVKTVPLKKKWQLIFLAPFILPLKETFFYTRSRRWALFLTSIGLSRFLIFETHRKALWYHNDPQTGEKKGIKDRKKLARIYKKARILVVSDPQTFRLLNEKRSNVVLLWEGWCRTPKAFPKKENWAVYTSGKDLDFLKEALSKSVYRNFHLDIFATKELKAEHLKFKGFLPHHQLLERIKSYRIGITTQEGIKIADYLESGLAVLAPELPSVKFVLEKQAVYYRYKDAGSFSEKLNFMLSQPRVVKKLGLNSLKLSRRYLWPTKIAPLIERLRYSA